jgi:hypothetical protein
MITVSHTDIINRERTLQNYLYPDRIDYEPEINDAKSLVLQDLFNLGLDITNLNVPLTLAEGTSSGTYESDESDRDYANRLGLHIEATSVTTSVVFQVMDVNDNKIVNVGIYKDGQYSQIIYSPQKKYKITVIGDCTFKVYVKELGIDLCTIYKALELIYRSLQNEPGSNWEIKANYYSEMYERSLNKLRYSYDKNEDGEITAEEAKQSFTSISYKR